MKLSYLAAAIVVVIAASAPASVHADGWASGGQAAQPDATSHPVGFSGSMKGTLSSSSGQCTQGFSNQCPIGPCNCFSFSGTSTVPKMGKGNVTISVTVDKGGEISSGGGDCLPAYIEFNLSNSKDVEAWDGLGTACDNIDGSGPLGGGFALQTSSIYSGALGQFALFANFSNGSFRLTYKGKGILF